jgi:hypothetical protein
MPPTIWKDTIRRTGERTKSSVIDLLSMLQQSVASAQGKTEGPGDTSVVV